ncbi:MAG TPA: 4Fe-4S binding protein [Candidatus Hydrothermia bacterium]|nr:4Fe-4S binding protein [Candidatus Hydrothermae bacterium]MDD3649450.1 4Fe-4S binding protein [Candidatus Hydrothermia bacterium]MDD5573388.1 4Fe-4S binding protein [Candidatus Hydrothermia bacterium]HOK22831.1 4Fe-4S binding protein [Candidatus Hydrothermia bacterium]HOL23540.1 4Fe-4S binding protein [Candidatus Hydrothermia bacterium]
MKLKGWKELPEGCYIPNVPTSPDLKTGSWRASRPIWDAGKCTNCLLCWLYCPDNAIILKEVNGNPKVSGINYDYCKGCGICDDVCPPKVDAIYMKKEEL